MTDDRVLVALKESVIFLATRIVDVSLTGFRRILLEKKFEFRRTVL